MKGERITVGTSATLLVAKGNDPSPWLIRTDSGAADVFLGGPDVTAATGYRMLADRPVSGELFGEDVSSPLYGIVSASTQVVQVLRRGT